VHKGALGPKCETCHDAASWKKANFDHNKTHFPLRGAHIKVACLKCHKDAQFKDKPPLTCIGCHKADDVHKGALGAECASCHSVVTWKDMKSFNHDKTEFPLLGAHVKVACADCHKDSKFRDKVPLTCIGCHKADDVHKGGFGSNCASCHNAVKWKDVRSFDHNKTSFPLVGRHKQVECKQCHTTSDFKAAPTRCESCHKDTFHKARLGPDCALCHSPKNWLQVTFDHNRQTKFPLTGAHVTVECHSCHTEPVAGRPVVSSTCVACHKKDDVHRGSFGPNCGRCHNTRRF
jgi:hypothetical protein